MNDLGVNSIDSIAHAVCSVMGVGVGSLKSACRSDSEVLEAKYILSGLCAHYGFTTTKIGVWCNAGDHTTVMYRIRKCNEFNEVDRRFARKYEAVREILEDCRHAGLVAEMDEQIESVRKHLNQLISIRDKLL